MRFIYDNIATYAYNDQSVVIKFNKNLVHNQQHMVKLMVGWVSVKYLYLGIFFRFKSS